MEGKYMNMSRKPVQTKHMRNSAKNKPLHATLQENKTNKKNEKNNKPKWKKKNKNKQNTK